MSCELNDGKPRTNDRDNIEVMCIHSHLRAGVVGLKDMAACKRLLCDSGTIVAWKVWSADSTGCVVALNLL
ncbi:hypothetical protein HPP92_029035 [Vanilla planifolia]|uniref:Uncharacterized protein n=1 Tax=Vanilla planifolia TaxID=51239 RepID=A0A835P394_VANPL|nr:hypothetical protein HPP92_029035 [Vanilla planifolia]KAG0446052.1 hypothetical protein HPP92_029023 [Vanilla planifolia]